MTTTLEDLDLSDVPPTAPAAPAASSAETPTLPQLVRLRSGGPAMSVAGVKDGAVQCAWFSGTELRVQAFPPSMLVAVKEPQS